MDKTKIRPIMNIYTHSSHEYVRILYVFLVSLLKVNTDSEVHLYLSSYDILDEDIDLIQSLLEEWGAKLFPILINKEDIIEVINKHDLYGYVSKQWNYNYNGMIGAYGFFDYIPKEVDRILRLHTDTIAIQSFSEFYNIDMKGNAVATFGYVTTINEKIKKRIGEITAYNENFALYDMNKIRDMGVSFEKIATAFEDIDEDEADNMNDYFYSTDYALSKTFNQSVLFTEYQYCYASFGDSTSSSSNERYPNADKTLLIHYDYIKPWNPQHCVKYSLDGLFWSYARITPYYKSLREEYMGKMFKLRLKRYLGISQNKNLSWFRNRIIVLVVFLAISIYLYHIGEYRFGTVILVLGIVLPQPGLVLLHDMLHQDDFIY